MPRADFILGSVKTQRIGSNNIITEPPKWTAKFGPWKLVQVEEYADYTGARKRELALKKQKGGNGLYKLLGRSFNELIQTGEKPGS